MFLKFYKEQIVKHDLVGKGCAIYLEHMLCFTPDLQRFFFVLTGDILVSFHNLIPPNLHHSFFFGLCMYVVYMCGDMLTFVGTCVHVCRELC